MPIYEYGCQKCGKKTEAIQRVGERPLRICPHCAGRLKKVASAPAIQFKGSGWYVTDYARAKKESGKTESRSASDGKSESTEKAGEKPAEKPAEKKKETKEKKTAKD